MDKMKHDQIVPCLDKIIVKRDTADMKTYGGLYIPETSQEEPAHGTVVAVGPGAIGHDGRRCKMSVKVGDKVYFTKNAVIDIQHNGSDHVMMKEDRVLLIED